MKNKITSEIGNVSGCTGSSKFNCDGTTVHCTIQGPYENSNKSECSEELVFEIRWKDLCLINNRMYEKYFAKVIEEIIEKYVVVNLDQYKTLQINFFISGEKRNTLFCAINAVLLALLSAGIPIYKMFYATSSFIKDEEFYLVDNTGVVMMHAFDDITEENVNNAMKYLEYVKESVNFTTKSNFPFKIE